MRLQSAGLSGDDRLRKNKNTCSFYYNKNLDKVKSKKSLMNTNKLPVCRAWICCQCDGSRI